MTKNVNRAPVSLANWQYAATTLEFAPSSTVSANARPGPGSFVIVVSGRGARVVGNAPCSGGRGGGGARCRWADWCGGAAAFDEQPVSTPAVPAASVARKVRLSTAAP
ncbi:hypothetical protein GCM10010528_04050 [Gordonia defluvii]|uniref:Uncharacterized protein n=1 Tax=Gordonia defluvii TaxID=283718 RepID=A0ABN3YEF5_9ACTN